MNNQKWDTKEYLQQASKIGALEEFANKVELGCYTQDQVISDFYRTMYYRNKDNQQQLNEYVNQNYTKIGDYYFINRFIEVIDELDEDEDELDDDGYSFSRLKESFAEIKASVDKSELQIAVEDGHPMVAKSRKL